MDKFIQVTKSVRLANYGGMYANVLEIQDASNTWAGFEGLDAGQDEPLSNIDSVGLDVADIGKLIAALQEMQAYLAGQGAADEKA